MEKDKNTHTSERKFWKGMFASYITIIILCFLLYVLAVAYGSFQLGKERFNLENSEKMEAVRNVLDTRLENANKMVSSINYSESVRALYKVLVENSELTSADYSTIQTDLRRIVSTLGNLNVDELLLFVNNQKRAFSPYGTLVLPESFTAMEYPKPYLYVDSISHIFSIDSNRVTMQKKALLYCDAFKYYGGTNRGVIVVNFSLDRFEKDIEKILGGPVPYEILYQGKKLFAVGEEESGGLEFSCVNLPDLKVRIFFPSFGFFTDNLSSAFFPIGIGFACSLVFLLLAFFFSQKYYRPIKEIKQLIPRGKERTSTVDEIDGMIEDLKGIIGVYTGYQETLTTISLPISSRECFMA